MWNAIRSFFLPKYPAGALVLLKRGEDSLAAEEWMIVRETLRVKDGWRYEGPIIVVENGKLRLATFCLCSEKHIESRLA